MREPEYESDERLAAAFDRAVDILADGGELSLDELAQGCEELRPQLAEVLRLAREVAVRPSEALPNVPGFELERELGRGGMGTVYLARQARVGGRRVALKVLPQLASANARARERFATEVRALSKLAHPGVVAIHDVVLERDVCAYAMEWIDGSSLADQIRAGAFGVERAAQVCELALVIARALHAAHEVGVIHRDVKPSNILLRSDGAPLLADFGLARDDESASASRSGGFVGTPAYAAPEQLRGESSAIDARTDVYSLGATIYHALIGRPPHEGRTSEQLLRQIERGARRSLRSVDPRLSRELETIVDKCLESDAGRRYASAAELADDLERLLKLQPIRARPAGWLVRASKLVRRNRATAWGAVAGSLVSLAAAAALVTYVFFVPRWVEEHVRDARLALLDPRGANAVFVAASWKLGPERVDPVASTGGLEVALERYDAALRWRPFDYELRDERDAVAVALGLPRKGSAPPSARARGLSEFLARRVDSALELWSEHDRARDPLSPPDPLLEAFVALLHLVEERPALAYPRLRLAAQSFPDVGFLATYLADAALGSGDLEFAERTLERAVRMPHLDPTAAHERVRADLFAARGLDAQAEGLYRSLTYNPVALLHFARFLESRGRREDAVQELTARPFELRSKAARRELVGLFERWWDALNVEQRKEHLALARTLPPHDPRSLVARCAVYLHARGGQRFSLAGMNPRERFSSPALESFGFPGLAEVLEVDDMHLWSAIPNYSSLLKSLLALAWRSPWPCAANRGLAALATAMRSRAQRAPLVAAALATSGGLASAQLCSSAPCFQGIGDLPGGALYSRANCLSGDGTRVGGASTTDLSTPQPFQGTLAFEPALWDSASGLVAIGELAGGLVSGEVLGLSLDGSVAVGWSASGNCTVNLQLDGEYAEGFHWSAGTGMVGMGDTSGGGFHSMARAVSDDGSQIAGVSTTDGAQGSNVFSSRASVGGSWTVDGGLGLYQSLWWSMSRNGQWMVGRRLQQWPVGPTSTILWSQSAGSQTILSVPNQVSSGFWANDVSDTGVVVGTNYTTSPHPAWRWTQSSGYEELADLPGGTTECFANAVTQDASIIVGHSTTALGREAALWLNPCAVFRLHDVLVAAGVSIPSGWLLQECKDITINGAEITICGNGLNPAGQSEGWVARFVAPWPAGVAYCTAGTTSSGCNASMSSSGTPSVAATSGFTLHCSSSEGQKLGLIFYGVNGPAASVWAPGNPSFLCVKSPVQRTPSANSGGTAGACDGAYSLDFLDYLATHPGALGQPFAAGQCVNAQTWFRDPPAPGTTTLSNGLQFVTTP